MGTTETSKKTPTTVARAYFRAVAKRDVDGMMKQWRFGTGVGHIHGMVDLTPPEDYERWFGALFTAFPDMEFKVLDITSEGTRAAVRWEAKGTFTGPSKFEGLVANGKKVEMAGFDLLTVCNGLIEEVNAYTNAAVLMRQLGALPNTGSNQEKAMMTALNLKVKTLSALKLR